MPGARSVHFVAAQLLLMLVVPSLPGIEGYPKFVDLIPNAGVVLNPLFNLSGTAGPGSPEPQFWGAIGHLAPGGGGPRNQFGIDFDSHKQTWSRELCQLDSDKDGKSNGVELGDPLCTWKPGQTPDNVTGITHPGICDPIASPICIAAPFVVPANQQSAHNDTASNNATSPFTALFPQVGSEGQRSRGRGNQAGSEHSEATGHRQRASTTRANTGAGTGDKPGTGAGASAVSGSSSSSGSGAGASANADAGAGAGAGAGSGTSAGGTTGRLPKTKAQQQTATDHTTTESTTTTTSSHQRSA